MSADGWRRRECDGACCALALLENWRSERKKKGDGHQVRVSYVAPTSQFRQAGAYLPPCLVLGNRSSIHLASQQHVCHL